MRQKQDEILSQTKPLYFDLKLSWLAEAVDISKKRNVTT